MKLTDTQKIRDIGGSSEAVVAWRRTIVDLVRRVVAERFPDAADADVQACADAALAGSRGPFTSAILAAYQDALRIVAGGAPVIEYMRAWHRLAEERVGLPLEQIAPTLEQVLREFRRAGVVASATDVRAAAMASRLPLADFNPFAEPDDG